MNALPAMILLLTPLLQGSDISLDEDLRFFSTYAVRLDSGRWRLNVQGWIFEREISDRTIELFLELLDLDDDDVGPFEKLMMVQRSRGFVVDNERGEVVPLVLGDHRFDSHPSGKDGHFSAQIELSDADLMRLAGTAHLKAGALPLWIPYRATTQPNDLRVFAGKIRLVDSEGISVVSDIDDTIKVTGIGDSKSVLMNTFARPYKPVAGMAELYRALENRHGAVFHYVSGSPWQLYDPLQEFMRTEGFPEGTFHLRSFRLRYTNATELHTTTAAYKIECIEPLMRDFPRRRFVLIGDGTQNDAAAYGDLARRRPGQVAAIAIRNLAGHPLDSSGLEKTFAGVPAEKWITFSDAAGLGQWLAGVLEPPAPPEGTGSVTLPKQNTEPR